MACRRIRSHLLRAVSAVALLTIGAGTAASAAEQTYQFDIPAENLGAALTDYSTASAQQIVYSNTAVSGKSVNGLKGRYTARQALAMLVADSGVRVGSTSSGVLTVTSPGEVGGADASTAKSGSGIETVTVSGTKQGGDPRKISGSVSVDTGAALEALGAQDFEDYLQRNPGVVFNKFLPGLSTVTIRGVSTTTQIDQGQGTTGYFINDVPLTDPYFSVAVPDIDAFDVNNVAVLRGPQGTLFGSGSLGGAINYEANKPDLDNYQAHVQGTVEDVDHGAVGDSLKAMVNIPVIPGKLAVRGVLIDRKDAGFIDNIGTGEKNSNRVFVRGGRFLVTYKPAAGTTINYMYLHQASLQHDQGYAQEDYGAYAKSTAIDETANFYTDIHNLEVDQDVGFATVTATATYHAKKQYTNSDYTPFYGDYFPSMDTIEAPQYASSMGYTFEARIKSKPGHDLDYIVGVYYDVTHEHFVDAVVADNAASAIDADYASDYYDGVGEDETTHDGTWFDTLILPFKGQEFANYGELTYHVSPTLKATFGWRAFYTKSKSSTTAFGFMEEWAGGDYSSYLEGRQHESGFLPKGSITWTPNQNVMIYGLVSEGYRFGGPNINQSTEADPIPSSFKSDSLMNYEFGTRTNWLNNTLQLDASLFYINWSDIQVRQYTSTSRAYATNAGTAHNYGVEASATYEPFLGLTLHGNVTYLHATLAEDFSSGGSTIAKGTSLPGAARWNISDSASYTFIDTPMTPTISFTHSFIGRSNSNFTYVGKQGGYNLFGLRGMAMLRDNVSLSVYVKNLLDRRGIGNTQLYSGVANEQFLIRPRTIGLTVDVKY